MVLKQWRFAITSPWRRETFPQSKIVHSIWLPYPPHPVRSWGVVILRPYLSDIASIHETCVLKIFLYLEDNKCLLAIVSWYLTGPVDDYPMLWIVFLHRYTIPWLAMNMHSIHFSTLNVGLNVPFTFATCGDTTELHLKQGELRANLHHYLF